MYVLWLSITSIYGCSMWPEDGDVLYLSFFVWNIARGGTLECSPDRSIEKKIQETRVCGHGT